MEHQLDFRGFTVAAAIQGEATTLWDAPRELSDHHGMVSVGVGFDEVRPLDGHLMGSGRLRHTTSC